VCFYYKSMNLDCFTNFPRLETPRLLLRQIVPTDAPRIFEMRKSVLVNSFIYRPLQSTIDEAQKLIERVGEGYKNKTGLAWAAERKGGSGQLLATCGFNNIQIPNRRAEIGGEMHSDFWGKGFAPEGLKAIIEYGFRKMDLHTIEAKVIAGNKSSVALLERYGFEKEGHLKEYGFNNGEPFDLLIFTLRKNRS
jgi:[ribosomal protein S5]-alanine N-acetyltransferase